MLVGEPLCAECFDYRGRGAVERPRPAPVGAHVAPPLPRGGPGGRDSSTAELRSVARLSYIKVVEFQRRGLVHLHVVLRADGGAGPAEPPPPWLDADVLDATPSARPSPSAGVAGAATSRGRRCAGPAGAPSTTSGCSSPATTPTPPPSPPTWPSTPPRRRTARRGWPIRSAPAAQIERLGLRPHIVDHGADGLDARGPQRARRTCACATTPTPSATAGSSPPRACASRPPSRRCAGPGPTTSDGDGDDDFDYDGEWRYAGRGYGDPEADELAADASLEASPAGPRRVPRTCPKIGSQAP